MNHSIVQKFAVSILEDVNKIEPGLVMRTIDNLLIEAVIKSIHWTIPNLEDESGEYFENPYTNRFLASKGIYFLMKDDLLDFLKTGKLITITKQELAKNYDNLTLTNEDFEKEIEDQAYKESFDSMQKELIEKGTITLPTPIVLKIKGQYFGFAGNRRMNLAFKHKLPLKVWLVEA